MAESIDFWNGSSGKGGIGGKVVGSQTRLALSPCPQLTDQLGPQQSEKRLEHVYNSRHEVLTGFLFH